MVEKVLNTIESPDLALHVVWTPVLQSDTFESSVRSQFEFKDARVKQYWDGDGRLGTAYGKLLPLPRGRTFAWDIYFAFPSGVLWRDQPPNPHEWSHQLGKDERHLEDGERLRRIVESLLNE